MFPRLRAMYAQSNTDLTFEEWLKGLKQLTEVDDTELLETITAQARDDLGVYDTTSSGLEEY